MACHPARIVLSSAIFVGLMTASPPPDAANRPPATSESQDPNYIPAPYDAEVQKQRAIRDGWRWVYSANSETTRLLPTCPSPLPNGRSIDPYDEYLYYSFHLPIANRLRDGPRNKRMLNWIDKQLRRRLRRAGLFDPARGIYPTLADATPYLHSLMEVRPGIGKLRGRSLFQRMLEWTPPLPEDFPLVRQARAAVDPDAAFISSVEGLVMLPFLPFEFCRGNQLLLTKRDPEAAKAHRWLIEHDDRYRAQFHELVQRFHERYRPDEVPKHDTPRLKLLSRLLQVELDEAGFDERIRSRIEARTDPRTAQPLGE